MRKSTALVLLLSGLLFSPAGDLLADTREGASKALDLKPLPTCPRAVTETFSDCLTAFVTTRNGELKACTCSASIGTIPGQSLSGVGGIFYRCKKINGIGYWFECEIINGNERCVNTGIRCR